MIEFLIAIVFSFVNFETSIVVVFLNGFWTWSVFLTCDDFVSGVVCLIVSDFVSNFVISTFPMKLIVLLPA